MSLEQFIDKYNGKFCDYDSYYGPQCVDLVQFYNRDVVGAPRLTGNAADIWTSYPHDSYDQIPNSPDNAPLAGDIIIWTRRVGGGAGHIAICKSGDKNAFTSFDQNWPDGSPCHYQGHDYTNVFGWLHPKKVLTDPGTDALNACMKDREQFWKERDEARVQAAQLQKAVLTLNEKISDMAKVIEQDARDDYDLGVEVKTASEQRDRAVADLSKITEALSIAPYSLDTVLGAIQALKRPVDEAVKPVAKELEKTQKVLFEEGLGIFKKFRPSPTWIEKLKAFVLGVIVK